MAEPVMMPQVGQDIKTARIVDWLKKENDEVRKGEVIAVVESDKAAFDVEAYASGTLLKILHPEGDEVEVLTPIAYIGSPGERIEERGPRAAHPTPSARRIAGESGISLDGMAGSGPGGRIIKRDVLAAVDSGRVVDSQNVIVFSPMRLRIAERLTRSKQTIPHFYLSMDADMSEAMLRRRQFSEAHGVKVTITDMVVKAAATALAEYPKMNSHVEPGRMILQRTVNVGIAVSVEDGLIVPVIAEADKKSIREIGLAVWENAEAARVGRLKPQAVAGFTVTNLGMHGVDTFVPVINPPEAAILAVGAVARRPAVLGDRIVARNMMTMTLACDHRAIDGAYAARFLGAIKRYLENPALLESQL